MRRKFFVALSVVVMLSGNTALAAFAQSSGTLQSRLAEFERVLFGAEHSGEPLEQRLGRLEGNVFGERKTGTPEARLDGIGKVVNLSSATPLMPPLAPSTDLGQSEPRDAPAAERKEGHVDASAYTAPDQDDLVKQGLQLYKDGRYGEAEQAFQQVLDKDPNNADALYNLGAIAEQRGDLDSALSRYRGALRLNPTDTQLKGTVEEISLEVERRRLEAEARAQVAEARAQAAEAQTQAAQAQAQAAEERARADRQFALQAEKDRRESQKISQPRAPMMMAFPLIRFSSGSRAPRALTGLGLGGGGSLVSRAAGFGLNGTRIGLTLAAIHCPKCRVHFAPVLKMLNSMPR